MARGVTPTQTVRARVRGERLADRLIQLETDRKQTTTYQRILELSRDATAQYNDDDDAI